MSFLSGFIKLSVVIACAAGSFGAAQSYMAAKAETAPLVVSKSDPIAVKLVEDNNLTGAMSPIYPTTKYTKAQLAAPSVTKKAAKVALRPAKKAPLQNAAHKMPLQIAYVSDRQFR